MKPAVETVQHVARPSNQDKSVKIRLVEDNYEPTDAKEREILSYQKYKKRQDKKERRKMQEERHDDLLNQCSPQELFLLIRLNMLL